MINDIQSIIKPDKTLELNDLAENLALFKSTSDSAKNNEFSKDQTKLLAQLLTSFPYRLYKYEKQLSSLLPQDLQLEFKQQLEKVSGVSFTYEQLAAMDFKVSESDLPFIDPWQHLKQVETYYKWTKLGLSKNDKGKIQLDANTFARYVLERLDLVQNLEGQIYYYNGKGVYHKLPDNVLKVLCKKILSEAGGSLWKRNLEAEYIAALKNDIPFEMDFDSDIELINFPNGYFDISKMKLVPHSSNYRSISQLPYEFNAEATCPRFESTLSSVFENDIERITLFQEMLGYLWLKEVKIHKAFIFLGKGSNGKSVLAKVIRHMLGIENVSSVGLKRLQGRFGLQEFPNKLANISSENEFSDDFTTENFKLITSGDSISIERKNKDSYTTTIYIKLLILLNKMMDCKDTSDGFTRRLVIIPFNQKYVELRQGEREVPGVTYMDPNLESSLLEELPGIFNFAMRGLQRLIANDYRLTPSAECDEALDQYIRSQNPIIDYFNQNISAQPTSKILRSSIYNDFTKWCKANSILGSRIPSRTIFIEELKRLAARKQITIREPKIQGHIYVEGIRLNASVSKTNNTNVVPPMI
ncbi:MAG: phage/plasmid primase, P4 family [Caryophanon sp.]|nr:phage/plasmid primase, P4 family [Caryophanon sp.]